MKQRVVSAKFKSFLTLESDGGYIGFNVSPGIEVLLSTGLEVRWTPALGFEEFINKEKVPVPDRN
jgi:hypothetical protein